MKISGPYTLILQQVLSTNRMTAGSWRFQFYISLKTPKERKYILFSQITPGRSPKKEWFTDLSWSCTVPVSIKVVYGMGSLIYWDNLGDADSSGKPIVGPMILIWNGLLLGKKGFVFWKSEASFIRILKWSLEREDDCELCRCPKRCLWLKMFPTEHEKITCREKDMYMKS